MDNRKPLIVKGARQTGKTWLLKEFGNSAYQNMVYINFEENPSLQNLFINDFDVTRIITALEVFSGVKIEIENTLIVLDEIQSADKGLTSLKYFYENAPEYHIIAAGSLLGILLQNKTSFPVGKVDFMDMNPLSFYEFLLAINEKKLADLILNKQWDMMNIFHDKMLEYLKYYLFVGGMPEVVKEFSESRDWKKVRELQQQLLTAYQGDFAKYAPREIISRIQMVWNSIPSQLSKENKKFVFNVLKHGARSSEYELAIQWLLDSGLLLKINRIKKPSLPIKAYEELNAYKLYLLDVGLLGAMSYLDSKAIIEGDKLFTEFKGAIAEQFAIQQLVLDKEIYTAYWANEKSTSEVDFIIQKENKIIALEIKSGQNLKSKSFKLFFDEYQPHKALKGSTLPYKEQDWVTNIPLYTLPQFDS